MRKSYGICLLQLCIILLAACQGPGIAPQQQTATAESAAVAQHIATLGSIAATNTAVYATEAVAIAATEAAPTDIPTETPTPDPFPTPVKGKIYVAEQRFERGWMFWLQPNGQIWLLSADETGRNIWSVYDDTFVEGEAEFDPQIVAPENHHQPIRGFGKLWRENLEVRQELGWALETEIGHTTRYEYHQGGHLNADNIYVPGPGYHLVRGASGDTFRFNEDSFTWSIDS